MIVSALKNIRVQMDIEEPKARTIQFGSTIFRRLEGVGDGNLKRTNSKENYKVNSREVFPSVLTGGYETAFGLLSRAKK